MSPSGGGPLASDADRDAAVGELGEHCAAGRIDVEELDRRVAAVHRAPDLAGVRAVLADLAGPPGPAPVPFRAAPPPGRLARLVGRLGRSRSRR